MKITIEVDLTAIAVGAEAKQQAEDLAELSQTLMNLAQQRGWKWPCEREESEATGPRAN